MHRIGWGKEVKTHHKSSLNVNFRASDKVQLTQTRFASRFKDHSVTHCQRSQFNSARGGSLGNHHGICRCRCSHGIGCANLIYVASWRYYLYICFPLPELIDVWHERVWKVSIIWHSWVFHLVTFKCRTDWATRSDEILSHKLSASDIQGSMRGQWPIPIHLH